MNEYLRDLYQEVIIDHGRNPRNYGPLTCANCTAEGVNPLCGDELTVRCVLDDNEVIQDMRFTGHGCAISLASASIMTEMLRGKTRQEAEALFETFRGQVTGAQDAPAADIGKLEALSGVREFPARVKCATLAWHTAVAAINGSDEQVTTE